MLRDNHFHTREEARHEVAAWIDDYNTCRRHSTNGMLSPVDYEITRVQQSEPTVEHHRQPEVA